MKLLSYVSAPQHTNGPSKSLGGETGCRYERRHGERVLESVLCRHTPVVLSLACFDKSDPSATRVLFVFFHVKFEASYQILVPRVLLFMG